MKIGLKLSCAFCAVAALLLASAPSDAQSTASSPQVTVSPASQSRATNGAYSFLYRFGASCGFGATTSPAATKPTFGCGVGSNPLPFIYTEVGMIGPQANRSNFSGYLSNDFIWPISLPRSTAERLSGHPIALVGYTRMFETGHALDYGVGFEHHVNNDHSLQFELRDYMTFANPTQHNVILRAVWLLGVPD